MYVAVKGGEKAIDNAHALLAEERRGDADVPELTLDQIKQQMGLAVDRVMGEAHSTIPIWRRWRSSRLRAIWSRPCSCCALSVRPCRAWPSPRPSTRRR